MHAECVILRSDSEVWKTRGGRAARLRAHRAHQGVEHTDSEGGAAGEGLSEVQLCVWVVIIILVQELNV